MNTILMHRTFKIDGPSHIQGKNSVGTVFLFDAPEHKPVLVTAAHVFKNITGDTAKLHLRKKVSEGKYEKVIINLPIRENDMPLWTSLPGVDIAVMYVTFLNDAAKGYYFNDVVLDEGLLATDALLRLWEIHPGDELLCLGYPYGEEANEMGFPILRSGKIASFPIMPAKDIKSFLFDFEVFGGNSGGPVYFVDSARSFGGKPHTDNKSIQCIMGVVVEARNIVHKSQIVIEQEKRKKIEYEETTESLGLAKVIPAYFIKEAITLLEKEAKEGKQANN